MVDARCFRGVDEQVSRQMVHIYFCYLVLHVRSFNLALKSPESVDDIISLCRIDIN